ncbi:MAG: phage terminase large subunit [Clostridia bacterium]|nr:phage terminase large subunit [Clostridia bacterium]
MGAAVNEQRRFAVKQLARQELARRSFLEYCIYVHRGVWKPGRHHRLIAEKLEGVLAGRIKRLMIFMPPRHGKSMMITETFPAYFLGRFPDKQVMEISYGAELATRFGRANRDKTAWFGKQLFGIQPRSDERSAESWAVQDHRGGMRSFGIGGAVTGSGADLLIIDDPIKNRSEAESETIRDRVFEEYRSTLLTRLHPGGAVIIVMTRWHEDDLCGRLLLEDEGWEVLSLPAVSEGARQDPLGRRMGAPLWPEHGFDAAWAEQTRASVGRYAWASLYQQRPAPAGGSVFDAGWWRFYSELPEMVHTVISVDATFKNTPESDRVAIQVWGKRGPDCFLLDRDTRRMDFPTTLAAVRMMAGNHPGVSQILIEDKANGSAIISMLENELPGVLPVVPRGGKQARAHAVSPMIESGHVFLPAGTVMARELMDECAMFPTGRFDDDVDAMTQALGHLMEISAEPQGKMEWVEMDWTPDMIHDFEMGSKEDRQAMLRKWT